jgi:hypothetical protein
MNSSNMNMNLSLNSSSNNNSLIEVELDIIDIANQIVSFYLFNIMVYGGTILNLVCILVFIKIIKEEQENQGHLFKYFLIKSVFDLLFCIQNLPRAFFYRVDSTINRSYSMQIWYVYSYYFLYSLFSQLSVWFEIAASLDCLCLISMKFKWHKTKNCFYLVVSSFIGFWTIFYIPNLFWFKIVKRVSSGYAPRLTTFGKSKLVYYHVILHNIFRDMIPIIILMIINSAIFYFIRKTTVRRKSLQGQRNSTGSDSTMVKKAQQAERNKIKMMFTTSLINIFHIPAVYYNLNVSKVRSNTFFSNLCLLLLTVSYVIPIFTYILFNNTFKRCIKDMFNIRFEKVKVSPTRNTNL